MTSQSAHQVSTYQFGDSDLAAERLRRLAAVFEPSSRAFLQSLSIAAPRAIADLGCGPGYTSRMLAEVFPTARVLGIDSSPQFVAIAERSPAERVCYAVADVAQSLPSGPFDVIYCRYLLTHLTEPLAAIARWSERLRPGGLLCIEENDSIRTTQPAFAQYLAIVEAMLADAGQKLYVGLDLDRNATGKRLRKQSSRVVPVGVTERAAAEMFLPNLATWRDRPFARQRYAVEELDRLRDDLQRLVDENSTVRSISFGLRRLVLQRTEQHD
ncbi:MAG: class I SAM-dependent methyltransferase [Pirellulales bacterium]